MVIGHYAAVPSETTPLQSPSLPPSSLEELMASQYHSVESTKRALIHPKPLIFPFSSYDTFTFTAGHARACKDAAEA